MKDGKIPYIDAELEVIRFSTEDVLTTSNIDQGGIDWNNPAEDDWGNTKGHW